MLHCHHHNKLDGTRTYCVQVQLWFQADSSHLQFHTHEICEINCHEKNLCMVHARIALYQHKINSALAKIFTWWSITVAMVMATNYLTIK